MRILSIFLALALAIPALAQESEMRPSRRVVIIAGATPSTLSGIWTEISNTELRDVCPPNGFGGDSYAFFDNCQAVTTAWNSGVMDTRRNRLIVWGGGHGDYGGNEFYAIDLTTGEASRLNNPGIPTAPAGTAPESLVSGTQANSRHTYDGIAYIEHLDKMFVYGGSLSFLGSLSSGTWLFNFATQTWEPLTPTGPTIGAVDGPKSAYDPVSGDVFLHGITTFVRYDPDTNVYTQLASGGTPTDYHLTAVIDPVARKFIMIGNGEAWWYSIAVGSPYTINALSTSGGSAIVSSFYPGLAYHAPSGKILGWRDGNTVYSLDLSTNVWTPITAAGGPTSVANGPFERWSYSPQAETFVSYNSMLSNAKTFRLTTDEPADTIVIHNTSGGTITNRPVSISRPFRRGEIASCVAASVGGTPATTQTDVKNRWPDGSLKFAIVSWVVPSIVSGGSVSVDFTNQATCNNAGFLDEAGMLAAGYNFDVDLTLTGAATRAISARTILDAASFRYWLQGPVVTSVIIEDRTAARAYDVDFGDASKALHPIFEARFYPQGSKVEVGATVENVWASTTAANGMRDLSYSISMTSGDSSPTSEFTHASFNHIGRSRWVKWFWLGADAPAIRIDHNLEYLTSTRAIPNYDTTVTPAESVISGRYTLWSGWDKTLDGDATRIGAYEKALGSGGAADWIGLMNTWDTLYLLTMDDRMWEMTLGNADLAGRLPWFYREADASAGTGDFFDVAGTVATLGRVVSVNARKTETLSDLSVNCGAPYVLDDINTGTITTDDWATSRDHMPDLAYLPYLLTGRYYYLEELQMQAAFIIGHRTGCYSQLYNRQGEAGYLLDSQVRGDAWSFRTLAYAAFISPDATPEKDYFEDKLKNNVALWEGERNLPISYHTKQANWTWAHDNRLGGDTDENFGVPALGIWRDGGSGFIQAPLRTDGFLVSAASPWEENFLLCAFGMARQFGYRTSTLMRYMAEERFHILLDPAATKYLADQYRIPTILTSTNNWINNWTDFKNSYSPIPTNWLTESTADHGYGFIALAAVSFLTDFYVDGYSGADAWALYKTQKPEQSRFESESPKWAIIAR